MTGTESPPEADAKKHAAEVTLCAHAHREPPRSRRETRVAPSGPSPPPGGLSRWSGARSERSRAAVARLARSRSAGVSGSRAVRLAAGTFRPAKSVDGQNLPAFVSARDLLETISALRPAPTWEAWRLRMSLRDRSTPLPRGPTPHDLPPDGRPQAVPDPTEHPNALVRYTLRGQPWTCGPTPRESAGPTCSARPRLTSLAAQPRSGAGGRSSRWAGAVVLTGRSPSRAMNGLPPLDRIDEPWWD